MKNMKKYNSKIWLLGLAGAGAPEYTWLKGLRKDEPKDEWSARIACNLRNDKKKKTLKQTLNRALPKQRSNPGDQACLLDPH